MAEQKVNPKETKKPHYSGHRDRLRQRFIQAGRESLADYELLELLLFYAIPRRDVKPLAKALIEQFGSLAEVLTADPESLCKVTGVSENTAVLICAVSAATKDILKQKVDGRAVLGSWQALLDYCHSAMAFNDKESFRILFLNRNNELIADEVQQTGTIDHTPVYPREVVKRALELNATALILVHNHPSGDPTPSQSDIDVTLEIVNAAKVLGISVHDHLIIAKSGHRSLKSMGLFD